MTRPKKSAATAAKKTRKQYPPAFREEALKLADVKGVTEAARALEIQPALIYNWRSAGSLSSQLGAVNDAVGSGVLGTIIDVALIDCVIPTVWPRGPHRQLGGSYTECVIVQAPCGSHNIGDENYEARPA